MVANVFNWVGSNCLVMANGPVNNLMIEGVACCVSIVLREDGVGGALLRWANAQLIYCVVSTPTGPSPLLAERIVMFLFCFISCRRRCCWSVRLEGVFVGLKMVLSCRIKAQMRVSTSLEGSGGRQEDLIRNALGS